MMWAKERNNYEKRIHQITTKWYSKTQVPATSFLSGSTATSEETVDWEDGNTIH